ncbi:hypothetical protein [Streptomyces sp. CB03911]|uniref:hypothetical protein n=1 Tax=Streptomycetaceae TaxID=2062 RepID=UPI00093D9C72|nr:hypothetical protein [Streptomyces sp. CB03911]OKI24773.1 hypothetical protein A6A07_32010 [Streptomyces sp. CB03911]
MSLSTRVIAAVGAVVVIGAGTVGGSIAYATGQDQPSDKRVTVTVGRSSQEIARPFCGGTGTAMTENEQADCQTKAKEALADGKIPSSDVVASDRIGVGVTPEVADKGWFAFTNGGQQGQFSLANANTGQTWSGSVPASTALSATGKTLLTVVESDPKTQDIYAVWYFQLKTQDA